MKITATVGRGNVTKLRIGYNDGRVFNFADEGITRVDVIVGDVIESSTGANVSFADDVLLIKFGKMAILSGRRYDVRIVVYYADDLDGDEILGTLRPNTLLLNVN